MCTLKKGSAPNLAKNKIQVSNIKAISAKIRIFNLSIK
jgi:hypothetical protein